MPVYAPFCPVQAIPLTKNHFSDAIVGWPRQGVWVPMGRVEGVEKHLKEHALLEQGKGGTTQEKEASIAPWPFKGHPQEQGVIVREQGGSEWATVLRDITQREKTIVTEQGWNLWQGMEGTSVREDKGN